MKTEWYVLRSKPRKENVLHQQVLARKIEVFFPRVRVKPANPRAARIRPYFPGYMFIKADIEEVGISTFQWMPHSYGLVSFDGEPASIPDSLIAALRKNKHEIIEASKLKSGGLATGTAVRITEGPFKGYQALFDARLSGDDRVRVLLQLLSDRQMPLELDVGQITPLNRT